ncbi:hypothetical protein [Lentilactobacillus sp. SPB1-3]|uniref:Uncharacterized protein n=1 Tax=Lentilactobacillus terminaliae TaxID=3003483 RepID=A0ACD5DCP5_9LACO|nr:hypothetical protein [Lentilactobacillus sp. SPB1-3]MCZ0978050.1 hypothetical protein [Lentilactobacillus sp. SPB1-3]
MTNEERLDKLEQENKELKAQIERTKNVSVWPGLKDEIRIYCLSKDDSDINNVKAYSLQTAIYTIIRFSLGISNVSSINQSNIDDARKVFEELKGVI